MPEKEQLFIIPPFKVEDKQLPSGEFINWGMHMYNIPDFWKYTKGENVKVAILDTGIDYTHEDLKDAIGKMENFTESEAGVFDCVGHGTHIAGIIGARENEKGIIGIAPKSELLVGKIMDDNKSTRPDTVIKGLEWAASNKADIISLSLEFKYEDTKLYSVIKEIEKANIFIICAAGNSGPYSGTISYPARYKEVISVGAFNNNLFQWNRSAAGKELDICAPGEDICSTFPVNSYRYMSGTSMAVPFVSGVTALLLAYQKMYPSTDDIKNTAGLKKKLQETAIDLNKSGFTRQDPTAGFDPYFGYGIFNPAGLMKKK